MAVPPELPDLAANESRHGLVLANGTAQGGTLSAPEQVVIGVGGGPVHRAPFLVGRGAKHRAVALPTTYVWAKPTCGPT